ncbi:hypothetical protein GCM10027425_02910 [Alteromonas gracilis]
MPQSVVEAANAGAAVVAATTGTAHTAARVNVRRLTCFPPVAGTPVFAYVSIFLTPRSISAFPRTPPGALRVPLCCRHSPRSASLLPPGSCDVIILAHELSVVEDLSDKVFRMAA